MLPLPVKSIYMGVNHESSNHMLPTTRLICAIRRAIGAKPAAGGPPEPTQVKPPPKSMVGRTVAQLRASLRLANLLSEEWFRQSLAWFYRRRGNIVLFDRDFFCDYYAHDIAQNGHQRSLSRQIHGFVLEHLYPKPDLVIFLDAPPQVLFTRKREGTLQALENRRQEYLKLGHLMNHFVTVDATQPQGDVTGKVAGLIWDLYQSRLGKQVKNR